MGDLLRALAVGLVGGGGYALIGVSISLMHRTTQVLSFAHAGFAAIAGLTYANLTANQGWPAGTAALIALVVAVVAALVVERVAMRPLEHAPVSVKMVATIAVLGFMTAGLGMHFGTSIGRPTPLVPTGGVTIAGTLFLYADLALFAFAALAVAALEVLFRVTRTGIAIRAVEDNREGAQLMGVSTRSIARLNWLLAGILAGSAGILLAPRLGGTVETYAQYSVFALAATVVGGLSSLPLTLAGGLLLGGAESVGRFAFSAAGSGEVAIAGLAVVVMAGRAWARRHEPPVLEAAPTWAKAPGTGRWLSGSLGRRLRAGLASAGQPARLVLVGGLLMCCAVGLTRGFTSEYHAAVGVTMLVYFLQSLSMVVMSGWGGQVSLLHGGFVGVASFMVGYVTTTLGWPVLLAVVVAAAVCLLWGVAVGLVSLRVSGAEFAILSVITAAVLQQWFFQLPFFVRSVPPTHVFGLSMLDSGNVFRVMLVTTALLFVVVMTARRSGWWRMLLCARDAPAAARHLGFSPTLVRLQALGLASFIAGIGGAFFGILAGNFDPFNFGLQLAITLLIYSVVSGIDSLLGPAIAAGAFGFLPQVIQGSGTSNDWTLVIGSLAAVGILVLRPNGLASLASLASLARPAAEDRRWTLGRFDAVRLAPPILTAGRHAVPPSPTRRRRSPLVAGPAERSGSPDPSRQPSAANAGPHDRVQQGVR